MHRPVAIADRDTIELALGLPALVPHLTDDPSPGATSALRRQMARFSGPGEHPQRRALVDAVIAGLDVDDAERLAHATALERLRTGTVTHADLATTIPTATLIELLALPVDAESATRDVEAIVRVIGRGEAADDSADAATERLLAAVPDPSVAVAVVSLLYQSFDATAALVATTLAARSTGATPEPAVRATRRVATAPTDVGRHRLETGDEVVLEIGPAGLPFGAGPHACPGRELAEAIVRGIVAAHDESAPAPG
ncbi:MAG: hypothetical protein R8G01_17645 [Ilumatobacteraceae bacterium]|nr:hypothetical protein [Ilumatobacteraceae bacterium]